MAASWCKQEESPFEGCIFVEATLNITQYDFSVGMQGTKNPILKTNQFKDTGQQEI